MSIALTNENYYSDQANADYMSVSQFKEFAGTLMHTACEDVALKNAKGLIPKIMTTPLLVGSYIDSFYEGTLDAFKKENRDSLCTKTSIKAFEKSQDPNDLQLLADFKKAEAIIEKTLGDELFSSFMSGQKQVIMSAKLFGTDWKIKMDSYFPGDKIVDLKIMRSMDPIWSDKCHMKSDFIRYWGYDIQGAIYQKVVEINTGKKLPFYIACATKEDPTNIEIIQIEQKYLDDALAFVEQNIAHVLDVKYGRVAAVACGNCYWCRKNKKLKAPIFMSTIVPDNGRGDKEDPAVHEAMMSMMNDSDTVNGASQPANEFGGFGTFGTFGPAAALTPYHLFGDASTNE